MAEGRRAHRHTAPRTGASPLVTIAAHAAGVVVAGLAWWYLVSAAIDFGGVALAGQPLGWLFALGSALGAVVCLVLLLVLVGRGLRSLGYISDYRPRRSSGKRRR